MNWNAPINGLLNWRIREKNVYDDDLATIARDEMEEVDAVYVLDYLHVSTGTKTVPTATVRLKKGNEVIQDAACGDGPVDAALKTIDRSYGNTRQAS